MTDEEIVTALAEKVMGWVRKPYQTDHWPAEIDPNAPFFWWTPDNIPFYCGNFNPLQSIADAWMIVEKMKDRGWWAQIRSPFMPTEDPGDYWCGFTPTGVTGWNYRPDNWTKAATAPRAICLAALTAVSV